MVCSLDTRWNGNNWRLPMVTNPEGVIWTMDALLCDETEKTHNVH